MVTGGYGFIGSHVVDRLVQAGHDVFVLDDFSTGSFKNLEHLDVIRYMICDISDDKIVFLAFDGVKPDIVIHLAAQAAITTAENDPMRDLEVNGIGTLVMLRNAMKAGVKRFVYAPTSAVYGAKNLAMNEDTSKCPDTYYGVSKYVGEMYARMMDIQTTVLRFGNVYGPRQVPIGENQVIARMMRHLIYGDDFQIFGDGEQKRDFVYVEDVARAVEQAAMDDRLSMHQVFNVAGGESYTVNQVAKVVAKVCELPGYDWEYNKRRMDERRNARMTIKSAFDCLNWKPETGLIEGLKKTAEWWKQ